jgi:hypothetical protein
MRLHLLLRIEGAPSAWQTSGDVIIGDTVVRNGLRYSGIEISERTNPREGTLDFDGVSVRIVATPEATAEFGKAPQLLTYLAESATDADATSNAITYSLDSDASGLFAIDATTGALLWSMDPINSGSLLLVNDTLLVLTESGELFAAPVNSREFKPVARAQILKMNA